MNVKIQGVREKSNMGSNGLAQREEAWGLQIDVYNKIQERWTIERYEVRLLAKEYTQTYKIDYQEIHIGR